MKKPQDLAVGDAVFYAREQAVGLIYETYTFVNGPAARPGVSVLLSDGRDLSGFNAGEADQFLQPLGATGLAYQFSSVGQLATDYRRGLFGEAFYCAQMLHIAQTLASIPAHGE